MTTVVERARLAILDGEIALNLIRRGLLRGPTPTTNAQAPEHKEAALPSD